AVVAPLERTKPATRRRARLAMGRSRSGDTAIGFHARASHRIVDLKTCLVVHPDLLALVPTLRALGEGVLQPGEETSLSLTRAATGIDLVLDLPRPPDLAMLEMLGEFAAARNLARLSWRTGKEAPMPVVERRPVQISFTGVAVDLPPDCFLQASEEAEAILRDRVLAFLDGARSLADLFSGVGTFTFPLAAKAKVHAVDGDAAAVAALQHAARRAGLAGRITTEARDLDRRPLRAEELASFDAVLFDPPYAGAKAAALELARSSVPRIVAVSCHPASFARDARLLVDGGYRLVRVVPVDQFLWSAEIELIAQFAR
ncbi:MAG: class I SAM-dependent RNA methyltransferase, partial [Stellaceae bacterium]